MLSVKQESKRREKYVLCKLLSYEKLVLIHFTKPINMNAFGYQNLMLILIAILIWMSKLLISN